MYFMIVYLDSVLYDSVFLKIELRYVLVKKCVYNKPEIPVAERKFPD